MSYVIKQPDSFKKELDHIFKKFPKAKKSIQKAIQEIAKNIQRTNVIPGFQEVGIEVRKARIKIKEYNISASKGLRLVFLVKEDKIVLCHIYHKAEYKSEQRELDKLKKALKHISQEI